MGNDAARSSSFLGGTARLPDDQRMREGPADSAAMGNGDARWERSEQRRHENRPGYRQSGSDKSHSVAPSAPGTPSSGFVRKRRLSSARAVTDRARSRAPTPRTLQPQREDYRNPGSADP